MEIGKKLEKANAELGTSFSDWEELSLNAVLSEDFIREYEDCVDWTSICAEQKLSEDFIREYREKVDWNCVSYFQELSEDFIREFKDDVDWLIVSVRQRLSEDFIREFKGNIEFEWVVLCQDCTESFIDEIMDDTENTEGVVDYVGLSFEKQLKMVSVSNEKGFFHDLLERVVLSSFQKHSDAFIRKHKDDFEWDIVTQYQKLSEPLIREFADSVDWTVLSSSQPLSEDFIREFADRVDWCCVSKYQKLSEGFIEEFGDRLDKDAVADSWWYKDTAYKKKAVMGTGLYECHDDHFIGWVVNIDDDDDNREESSETGESNIYKRFCDHSADEKTFGFVVWDADSALKDGKEGYSKVKVRYEDVGRVLIRGNVRCSRLEVIG